MSTDHSRFPYYAVIFTSKLNSESTAYQEMAVKMEELARQQDGFIGFESARSEIGLSISYWSDLDSIKIWKNQIEHKKAQDKGQSEWYSWYKVRICKVEREYEFRSTQ
ncbi:MAG: antibiotic biosynthesis monooxygenase [Flavobacteriaceae bacterium]|nr:antibiotic biosynthesis monooxygenase [Flavobacteriaceae bacterium]NNL78993.1 antibiotic biosynthesis monooxygenase [Flavobacteriaceae bacterium]